jgi:hypothetical protein
MKKLFTPIAAVILSLSLIGCAAPPTRIAYTESGKPQITIPGVEVEAVRTRLIERALTAGFSLDNDSANRIVISKELDGMQESIMRLAIANANSSPVRLEFVNTLLKTGKGVSIFGEVSLTSQMPFGQLVRKDMSDKNVYFNSLQSSYVRLSDSLTAEK